MQAVLALAVGFVGGGLGGLIGLGGGFIMVPLLVYLFHMAFYALFLLRLADRDGASAAAPAATVAAPASITPAPAAAHPVRLVLLHGLAFAVLYFGLGRAVWSRHPTRLLFAPHPILGGAVMLGAAGLVAWALLVFRSWRLLARIEHGHQLCTSGPCGAGLALGLC